MALLRDGVAFDVYKTFLSGKGGDEKAWEDGYTRKTIDISKYMLSTYNNSLYANFKDNLCKTKMAIEAVMSASNNEIYISTSVLTH